MLCCVATTPYKTKNLRPSGTEISAVPPCLPACADHSGCCNGLTRNQLIFSPVLLAIAGGRRVRPQALRCAYRFSAHHRFSGGWSSTPAIAFVDPERFELSAFSMPLRRAPNCAMGPWLACHCSGPGGIRTLGLFSAIEARSQLRYRPSFKVERFYPCARRLSSDFWQKESKSLIKILPAQPRCRHPGHSHRRRSHPRRTAAPARRQPLL